MASTVSSALVLVRDRSSMMVSSEVSGRPRQLTEIYEKSRCSIGFHLLVAGGRGFTVTASPVSFENCCNSFFHNRFRVPFEPPPSEVTSNSFFFGYRGCPTFVHHRLMDSTAKAAVSGSIPRCTNPAFLTTSYTP